MARQSVNRSQKKPSKANPGSLHPTWDRGSEPDVIWGHHGIDALLWADPPPPYEAPRPKTADARPEPTQGGEAP